MLADWIERGLPCSSATLLTPFPQLRYSGTVPGWIAGQYARDFGLVDLAGLAARAGVELVLGRCAAIDPEANVVTTGTGARLSFDIASIDTGGVGRARDLLGDDPSVLDIRPIDAFVERLEARSEKRRIAVVGGGAGGVELAFALRNLKDAVPQPDVIFITGKEGFLPNFSHSVRGKVNEQLERQGITVIKEDARIEAGTLKACDRSHKRLDAIVAALGSAAPEWPRASGLACDERGFLAVDAYQRSTSHAHIFAVGDVAARQDRHVPHSGVHAVMAGPALAANLRASVDGKPIRCSYKPRKHSLYLMSTGDGAAVASYGPLAAHARWVARLKHWIDSRWLARYAALARDL